jgi:NAD(P)-dependent dehydrogenase (short-subunit alcohol dehydrogenase family)
MNATFNARDLTSQVAIVTGGGRGLGQAFALSLASAGAAVAVVARSGEQLTETVSQIRTAGGQAQAFVADVTDRPVIERTIGEIQGALGPVDLLVNNAGVVTPLGPIWEVDPDEWWHTMDTNLRGPFLCARAVLPSMIQRRRGRIVNISSTVGMVPVPYWPGYTLSKCALIHFTNTLAAETAEYGVRVFAVSPGPVRTGLSGHVVNSPEGKKWAAWYEKYYDAATDDSLEKATQLVLQLASGGGDALSGRFITTSDNVGEMVQRLEEIKGANLYSLTVNRFVQ